eukprot:2484107-Rhodomonas_salina.1
MKPMEPTEPTEPKEIHTGSESGTTASHHYTADCKGERKTNYLQRLMEVQRAAWDAMDEGCQNTEIERESLDGSKKEAHRLVHQASSKLLGDKAATELRCLRERRDKTCPEESDVWDGEIHGIDYVRGAERLLAHMAYLEKAREHCDLERYGLAVLQQADTSKLQGQLQEAFELLWNELKKLEQIGIEIQGKDASVVFLLERQRRFYHELVSISIDMGKMEQAHAILCLAKGKALNQRISKIPGADNPASGNHSNPLDSQGERVSEASFLEYLISAVKSAIQREKCTVVEFCMLPSSLAVW